MAVINTDSIIQATSVQNTANDPSFAISVLATSAETALSTAVNTQSETPSMSPMHVNTVETAMEPKGKIDELLAHLTLICRQSFRHSRFGGGSLMVSLHMTLLT